LGGRRFGRYHGRARGSRLGRRRGFLAEVDVFLVLHNPAEREQNDGEEQNATS
jgi:hypothetical protein